MSVDLHSLQGVLDPSSIKVGFSEEDYDVGHLDFTYISTCLDLVELEYLLRKLKSGEEGCYPQLEDAIQTRMESIDLNYQRFSNSI